MNVQTRVLLVTLAAMAMMSPTVTFARNAKVRLGKADLASLKVGHWIRLEGSVQKDHPVLCSEVRILAGDFLDDDWGVRGVVGSLDPKRRRFTIGPYSIVVSRNAAFENSEGTFNDFPDLRSGMLVEVEGSYRKDGTFLADEVDEADEVVRKPGFEKHIQIVAKVERVDLAKRQITVMGTLFQVMDETQVKSALR